MAKVTLNAKEAAARCIGYSLFATHARLRECVGGVLLVFVGMWFVFRTAGAEFGGRALDYR